jgi:hypothetical protein
MTRSRWWLFAPVLALAVASLTAPASPPSCGQKQCGTTQATKSKWKQVTYSLNGVVSSEAGADLLIKTIKQTIRPKSWDGQGGRGTIFYPQFEGMRNCLVVHQTAAVHKQLASMLKGLEKLQATREAGCCEMSEHGIRVAADGIRRPAREAGCCPPCCPSPVAPASYSAAPAPLPGAARPAQSAKQYGHFVLDNVKINAMGVSTTIKRVRFMYRGDGIEADVAKCALTGGESVKAEKETGTATGALIGAGAGALTGAPACTSQATKAAGCKCECTTGATLGTATTGCTCECTSACAKCCDKCAECCQKKPAECGSSCDGCDKCCDVPAKSAGKKQPCPECPADD